MRIHNLLRLFKRNRSLTKNTHHRSHRSPLLSGYHFALLLIASLLLVTCSLNRTLSIPLAQYFTPELENQTTAISQPELAKIIVTDSTNLPGTTPQPKPPGVAIVVESATAQVSPSITLPPTSTQTAATSTPGVLATSDLLFISDNRLLRWDHVTHYSSSLAENVVAFSTNGTGSKIVLLRPRSMAANGNELYDLDLLDFSSKQTRRLIEGTTRLLDMALSPDGNWLAYQHSPDGDPVVTLLHLLDPTAPIILGQCETLTTSGCTPPAWSPDSQSLIWGDRRGLWIAEAGKGSAALLHPSTVEVQDPQGKTSQIDAQFSSPEWSPVGRFALVQVIPNLSKASWHAVIDSLTGRSGQVIDSYELSPEQVSIRWLPNGKLVVARSSDQEQQIPAAIQVWDVLATNPELVVSTRHYRFPTGILPSEATTLTVSNPAIDTLRLDWIQQSTPGHLLFGAIQPDVSSQASLFDLNLQTNSISRLVRRAPDIKDVLWAPDGSGMLIIASDGKAYFTSADGKETFHLESSIGSDPTGFIWLPPSLRK